MNSNIAKTIVISGKARVGKDTVAKYIKEILNTTYGFNYKTIAYADELKKLIGSLFNLSEKHLYGNLKSVPLLSLPKKDGSFWTTRGLLQYFGTDVFRTIDANFWVLKVKYKIIKDTFHTYIITDGRFKNEIDWVLDNGGIYIRVEGLSRKKDVAGNHISETQLDNYYGKVLTFNNNYNNIEELKIGIKKNIIPYILTKYKRI